MVVKCENYYGVLFILLPAYDMSNQYSYQTFAIDIVLRLWRSTRDMGIVGVLRTFFLVFMLCYEILTLRESGESCISLWCVTGRTPIVHTVQYKFPKEQRLKHCLFSGQNTREPSRSAHKKAVVDGKVSLDIISPAERKPESLLQNALLDRVDALRQRAQAEPLAPTRGVFHGHHDEVARVRRRVRGVAVAVAPDVGDAAAVRGVRVDEERVERVLAERQAAVEPVVVLVHDEGVLVEFFGFHAGDACVSAALEHDFLDVAAEVFVGRRRVQSVVGDDVADVFGVFLLLQGRSWRDLVERVGPGSRLRQSLVHVVLWTVLAAQSVEDGGEGFGVGCAVFRKHRDRVQNKSVQTGVLASRHE